MKKITKMLCAVLGVGFLVAGCATVGSIKNSSDEIIYNGNSAVMVDGYLYYGNSFADFSAFTSDSDYKKSASMAYLARLNSNIDLASKSKDFTPNGVEKVATEVVGQANDFMFVLGDYIYYATPNRQKVLDEEGKSSHYFNYTTLFRSKLNGDNKQKIYTTNGEVSQIEVLKFDSKYYIVMFAGTDLIKIELGKKIKTEIFAEDVKSAAIPKTYQKDKIGSTLIWNGYVYYTADKKDEDNSDITGSVVYRTKISGGETEEIFFEQGKTISFVGREKDVLFYSMSGGETEIYKSDLIGDNSKGGFRNKRVRFYSASSISNLVLIATENVEYGYIFNTASNAVAFVSKDGSRSGVISLNKDGQALSGFKTLFVSGRTIYMSTTTGLLKADVSSVFNGGSTNINCETIVTMTAIYDGDLYAFDGKYIYYYAKLEEVEKDEEDEANIKAGKEEDKTDDNYYMYRVRVGSSFTDDYELLGKSQLKWRQTK